MFDPIFFLVLALAALAFVFFAMWLNEATRVSGRDHDHLIPATPRAYRAPR